MFFNSNYLNQDLAAQIKCWKGDLRARLGAACGFSADLLADRLSQRILEIAKPKISLAYCQAAKDAVSTMHGTKVDCGLFVLEVGSGRLKLKKVALAREWFNFFIRWCFVLVSIVRPGHVKSLNGPATLMLKVGDAAIFKGGRDHDFVNFCRSGPIVPLRKASTLVVETAVTGMIASDARLIYARYPLLLILRQARLGFREYINLLCAHILLLVQYSLAAIKSPELFLIGSDFYFVSVARQLDRLGWLENVMLTCSIVGSQPMWQRCMVRAKIHMLWYAQNWKPVRWIELPLASDYPELACMSIDEHWVWTQGFADYLRSLGQKAEIHAVGPILWYLPQPGVIPNDGAIHLSVFDVSPFSDSLALRHGQFPNYNNPCNLFLFISDVLQLADCLQAKLGKKVLLRLKTKRGYQPAYDKGYFEYLQELESNGMLVLEDHGANLFSMVSSCHLVLVYPFTSPAYVATHFGVPAIFHDPTAAMWRPDTGDYFSGVNFSSGMDDLLSKALLILDGSEN